MGLFDKTYVGKAPPPAPTPASQSMTGSGTSVSISSDATAESMANGNAAAAAGPVSSQISSGVGTNTTNSAAAKPKLPVKDPIRAAFSGKGKPTTQGVITDAIRGKLTDLNLGPDGSGAEKLAQVNEAQLMSLAERFGTNFPETDDAYEKLMDTARDTAGAYSKASAMTSFVSDPPVEIPDLSIDTAGYDEQLQKFADFATKTIKGKGLNNPNLINDIVKGGFTSGLPAVADAAGELIPDLPGDMDPDTLDMIKSVGAGLFGIATDAFCGGYTRFGLQQNLFNSLAGLSAEQGLICALSKFLEQTAFVHSSTLGILRSKASGAANRGMAAMVEVIAESVGPGTLSDGLGLATAIMRKGVVTEYDAAKIGETLTSLNVEIEDIIKEVPEGSVTPFWKADKIKQLDGLTVDTLVTSNITKFTDRSTPVIVETFRPISLLA